MDCGDYALQKLQLVLDQTSRLLESEFPHSDSKQALDLLKNVFVRDKNVIESCISSGDKALKEQACAEANFHIARFLPILGFSLRSTNTRNAFEFFVPLIRMARKILQPDAKLILSSEWDYSPFTYPFVFSELPNFVLIGLPASESENPLIIPLAGHELGHSIWKIYDLFSRFSLAIETSVFKRIRASWTAFERHFGTGADPADLETDLAVRPIWSTAREWSRSQLEEIFCDVVGVRLFGESYFHAMEYLLSPHFKNRRSPHYPDIDSRTGAMVLAASSFGINAPPNFASRFTEQPPRLDVKQRYLLGVADAATAEATNDAIAAAGAIADNTGILLPNASEIGRIRKCFNTGIPACGLGDLADIVNAGWQEYIEGASAISADERKEFVLRLTEIILKTIEVMEFEIRTAAP